MMRGTDDVIQESVTTSGSTTAGSSSGWSRIKDYAMKDGLKKKKREKNIMKENDNDNVAVVFHLYQAAIIKP